MIELHQFPPAFGLANASPFAIKLQAYCKLAKIEYKNHYRVDSHKMPKGKLPVAIIEGEIVADSSIIIKQLEQTYQLDASLTEKQHAQGYLLQQLCDEQLYWALVYSRWLDDDFWPVSKQEFFGKLPVILKLFVPKLMRKKAINNCLGQGMARHKKSEVYAMANKSIDVLASLLGDSDYFLHNQMTSYDCAIYGILTNFLNGGLETPIKKHLITHSNLVEYIERCNKTSGI
ncbi:glutathione S-transferase family protein [Pseudoalteromonas denitrificans]|uniref:Glutathione S-transferase n=1 Tax=Pseudoalteromonas denitrificans DSM 6059 TaxID=1123010 RepID=A0A1I1U6I7_9GAMM|nr:glutathione S-transferase family protein [Pseudoalteromonas denitrificans]SFD66379.1 Glutathione S-transferase [Pseudoalteromonas denitrificans DSM 6059]